MTNRREVLRMGLVVTALPVGTAVGVPALGVASDVPVELYKVVYDTRFAASVAFARRAAAQGLEVVATAGDVTQLWYDDLYHRWKREPVAIAGLTAHGALFCLEQLAWDQRMRVVFRAEHSAPVAGCVEHAVHGPTPLLAAAESAARTHDWPVAMADVVTQCPAGRVPRASARATTLAPSVLTPAAEPLFSWVIAPLARA